MSIKLKYLDLIRQNCTRPGFREHDLEFWRNKVFFTTIIYVLPLSLIALVPGLYWVYQLKAWNLAAADLLMVGGLCAIAFAPGVTLGVRKALFIGSGYVFSFVLLYDIGSNGPGLAYLLACSIFSTLIFSNSYQYWSAWLNTLICLIFWLIISTDMLPAGVVHNSNPGEWIAVSVNLIFLSFLFCALIPRLFKGLQNGIEKEIELKKQLVVEKQRFVTLFMKAPFSMGVFNGPDHLFAITNQK